MRTSFKNTIILLGIALLFSVQKTVAQMGFCSGNTGAPIFEETFGTGTTDGPALSAGTTTYSFTTGTPSDGSYTVSSTTNYYDWHDTQDHTQNDIDGKILIVNASYNPGEFYRRTVTGLCENTSYEFSSWVLNMAQATNTCDGAPIPVNVKFEIWDETDTSLLASGNTGNISGSELPDWKQYGLVFQTLRNQTSVILKMTNNGVGGCGNDLGIDDIVFRSCGDLVTITDNFGELFTPVCQDQGAVALTLRAFPDASVFATHAYQWQESADLIAWTDILGEDSDNIHLNFLDATTYYRVKVAEDAINLSNPLCHIFSEVFDVRIVAVPDAPVSNGDVAICGNTEQPLSVSVGDFVMVNWYDAAVDGNLVLEDSTELVTQTPGTYYAEASSSLADCDSSERTAVSLVFYEVPAATDEDLVFCESEDIVLSAGLDNVTYTWNTGEISKEITVDTPGEYSVILTNENGCTNTKSITLTPVALPLIEKIESVDSSILIATSNTGDFEYSLNDGAFQEKPVFESVEGGMYIVNARNTLNCGIVSQEYIHLVVPKFFTPNGDGVNDTFALKGLEFFTTVDIGIFDRFGKVVVQSNDNSFSWDGTVNNGLVPASGYWYRLKVDNVVFSGHFTLKR